MRKLNKTKSDSYQLALTFLGLLKEDAFWHVLVGFRKKYTSVEVKDHIHSCVHAFMKLL
jgi:hypothetical protein